MNESQVSTPTEAIRAVSQAFTIMKQPKMQRQLHMLLAP